MGYLLYSMVVAAMMMMRTMIDVDFFHCFVIVVRGVAQKNPAEPHKFSAGKFSII